MRETWGVITHDFDEDENLIEWTPDRPAMAVEEMPFGIGYYSGHVVYAADGELDWGVDDEGNQQSCWKPSIHMPRIASRIELEITGIRVERLQDISRGDAMAEGCPFPNMAQGDDPRQWYAELWVQLNGPGSWDENPWVWCIDFKRIKP